MRIFTGAPVPPGFDAVVMQERCCRNAVTVQEMPAAGLNIRHEGEDVAAGERRRRPRQAIRRHRQELPRLASRPLIAHVVERIDGQVSRLVVNTNSTDVRYRELSAALCPDAPMSKPATGPLVGLASVFAEIAAGGGASSYVLSVSVDTPFLPFDLTARFSDALRETGTRVAFAASGGRDHPTVALWDRGAGDELRGLFDEQPEISLRGVMTRL